MILYRYEKRGEVFVPQHNTGTGWNDFTLENVSGTTLGNIARSLFNTCYPGKEFNEYFKDSKKTPYIFFDRQIYASAFLGAAKSWYTNIAYEYDVDIKMENNE